MPIYRASPNCYAIDIKHIASRFNLNVFLWLLCIINWPDWENFSIKSILGVIFVQNWKIWPPGVPINRVSPNSYAIDIKDIASMFSLNVCGFYVLSNGPNCEIFSIISIFGVIFGHWITQINHKTTFRLNLDPILSISIA